MSMAASPPRRGIPPSPARISLLLALALVVRGDVLAAEAPPVSSWLGNQSAEAPWAGFVRGVGLGATGTALYTGEHGEALVDQECLEELATHVAGLIAERDVVLPVGGLGSARRQSRVDAFMALIESDAGATWKEIVHMQAERLARLPGGLEHVYWQVGNEINSRHYSLTLAPWTGSVADEEATRRADGAAERRQRADGDRERRPRAAGDGPQRRGERRRRESDVAGAPAAGEVNEMPLRCGDAEADDETDERRREGGSRNDRATIPVYAEYFLAPTIAGLHAAAKEIGEEPGAIHVMLGTLANARSKSGQAWLAELLDYELEGRFAPELAGKRVHELVHVVAIHYVVSYPGPEWRQSLDELASRWLGKGSITAMWSTEEVGRARGLRGLGASFGLRVAFRYFDWARGNGLEPREARVNFYGGSLAAPHTHTGLALGILAEHFAANGVERVPPSEIETDLGTEVEAYGMAARAAGRWAYATFPAGAAAAGRLGELSVPLPAGLRTASATLHLFTPNEHRQWSAPVEVEEQRLVLGKLDVPLEADGTLLVLVEAEP
jgi:hypothetical protein